LPKMAISIRIGVSANPQSNNILYQNSYIISV
jgi:hypothetical protein